MLSISAPAMAQSRASIDGMVVDAESGSPLAGAYLHLGQDDGPAALSDEHGAFRLAVNGDHTYELIASHAAYKSKTLEVPVSGSDVSVDIALEFGAESGEVVIIHGVAPALAEPTTYDLSVDDIRTIPGAGNDALKSLQTMPGVGRVPFGMGGLILRGTSPRNSSVFLDGIEVPFLYHFGALASFYPSAMLDSLELVPGAYSAENGRALGGVVNLESRPGRGDRQRLGAEVSLMDASVRAEGAGPAGGVVMVGARHSHIGMLLPYFADENQIEATVTPAYWDAQLRYDLDYSADERLSLMLFSSNDGVELNLLESDLGSGLFEYHSKFVRTGLRWQTRKGPTAYSVLSWVGYDKFDLKTSYQEIERSGIPAALRAKMSHTTEHGYVALGFDAHTDSFKLRSFTDNKSTDIEVRRIGGYLDMALWTEGLVRFAGGRLNIKPGFRGEYYSISDEWVADPRMIVSHEFPAGVTLRESMGIYHQPPLLADRLWGNEHIRSSHSTQSTVGLDLELPFGLAAGMTGFFSTLRDLPVDDPTAEDETMAPANPYIGGAINSSREFTGKQFGSFSVLTNEGKGESFGLELLLKRSGRRWFGWISYTLSRSERHEQRWGWRPYVLDQPHVFNALASTRLGRWRVGARILYATGTPRTPVIGAIEDGGDYVPVLLEPPFSERLPSSLQIDFRIDRTWRRSWGMASLYLDIQNLTDRMNVEGLLYSDDYSTYEYTRGLPFFPSFGFEIRPADESKRRMM